MSRIGIINGEEYYSLPKPQSYFISLAAVVCTLSLEFSSPEKNELVSNFWFGSPLLSTENTVWINTT